MGLKADWVGHCLDEARTEADFYSGCRKIIRTKMLKFYSMDNSLQMEHIGYTKAKMSHLKRLYLHQESLDVAVKLWSDRRQKAKYGSVGVTCYNHFIKNDPNKKSKRASVMGPCLQSMTVTWLSKTEYAIDVFYRTTELFKKFPADLVFIRDVLMAAFDFDGMKMKELTCHFANITIHPMYAVCVLGNTSQFVPAMQHIKEVDPYFHDWMIKWTARYTCEEHQRGIQKFAQALRVKDFADDAFTGRTREKLNTYLRDNHPGHRNGYVDPDAQEEDDEE